MLVGAGSQQPALVVGQAVADEQDVVLLGSFTERLAELRLLVLHRGQNKWGRIQTQAFWPLHIGEIGEFDAKLLERSHGKSILIVRSSRAAGHLWVLERRVDGETGTEARQRLEVGGVGQRPTALSVHGESQRFEVLAVNVPLPTVHGLQQILTGNDLGRTEQQF